ncbi:hypothetical protein CK203_094106 [Vitis vinifera]|uniref:Retrotransposon gag domain-containing protein n=1 Tax=Vitis vinifera TaxID=29760 RepID=A0A438CXR2_VITVI|nr:hypothetical protein CK203_094106 [Vitis vinifera]
MKTGDTAAVFHALLEHFPKSIFTFYIPFQSSESQESNDSNHVRFGAEMRKIWPSEDNCIKLRDNFARWKSRDQEGRLVRIENPQDTELDICVKSWTLHQRIRILNKVKGLVIRPHIVPLLPTFHGMESENPYSHIKEFEEDQWVEETNLKLFCKENEKFHECWERYMEAINACPHHGFDTWLLVSYFYDGMSSSMKQILETMCGGDFMSKNPEEAMDFLSYVAEVSRGG